MIDLSQYELRTYREGGAYVECNECNGQRKWLNSGLFCVWTIADAVKWAEAHEASEHHRHRS